MNKSSLKNWENFYENAGISENIYAPYLEYSADLLANGVPPIFEFNHLANLLGRTPEYLGSVINSSENHYREFSLKKRSGGVRVISAPYPALLECQRWINKVILSQLPINKGAHGFTFNKSIRTNASAHIKAKVLLKMDIQDFFPSIGIRRVISIFRRIGYAPNVSYYLASMCCLNDVLPQGAATSPAISNLVCRALDARLNALAASWDLVYTRYADDMTFSGEMITSKFIKIVQSIIEDEGFVVNLQKTRLIHANKKIVTGISISDGNLSVPRDFKRSVRKIAHYIIKYGYISHVSKLKIRDAYYLDRIQGKLLFWNWVEPDAEFPRKALPLLKEIMNEYKPKHED